MKFFNILVLLNFIKSFTIPPAMSKPLPPWMINSPKSQGNAPESLPSISTKPSSSLNKRHCGQSQQSAVLKQRARQITSQLLGEKRKKLAKPKKSKK